MTSDAKIGLLLGLVFIFIIAFIINGLPTFRHDKNNNELTTTIIASEDKTPGIGETGRDVIRQTTRKKRVKRDVADEVQPATTDNRVRFTIPLSEIPLAVKETDKVEPPGPAVPGVKKEKRKVEPSRPTLAKIHVVAAGDNLSVIAKKFYGDEEGNRLININRIFQANRGLLKSPDEVYEGQKIVVPALPAPSKNKNKTENTLISPMLEPVESIGRRHVPEGGPKTKQGGYYVVQEDDNLWRIAAERLGDGSRYREIAKLNAGILADEDSLSIGMRLKIPTR
ncbi:MAG: LysM peptidoglycan-binding domain-containing protein [Planctomycetota bacterium]|jgi:nucleoid-associated protein YgaU